MKFIKNLLYGVMAIIIAACILVLICAFVPGMSTTVSEMLHKIGWLPEVAESESADPIVSVSGDENGLVTISAIPQNVSELNGYKPVGTVVLELEEADAEALQQKLEQGDDGAELSFDPLFYPYYALLNSSEQTLYKQILANAKQQMEEFAPVISCNTDQVRRSYNSVVYDHPELFFLKTEYSVKYTPDGNVVAIDLEYLEQTKQLQQSQTAFDAAALQIADVASSYESALDKEKYVHDKLVEKVQYQVNSGIDQSAYSALVNGKSVCAGYARAFQYVMQKAGIPCYYCVGYSGQDHAWNIILLDGVFYNVDVTWDDTNPATYDYLNKSDADYAGTHMRTDLSVYLPPCPSSLETEGAPQTTYDENGVFVPTADGADEHGDAYDHINPTPSEPMNYEEELKRKEDEKKQNQTEADKDKDVAGNGDKTPADSSYNYKTVTLLDDLSAVGLNEKLVLWTLDDYYADCKAKLIEVGSGQKQYSNVVPVSLYNKIEQEYGVNAFEKAYMDAALKELKMENYSMVLQIQNLGHGFYRIYHNIVTY